MSDSFSLEEISRPSEVSNSPFVDLPMTLNLWAGRLGVATRRCCSSRNPSLISSAVTPEFSSTVLPVVDFMETIAYLSGISILAVSAAQSNTLVRVNHGSEAPAMWNQGNALTSG